MNVNFLIFVSMYRVDRTIGDVIWHFWDSMCSLTEGHRVSRVGHISAFRNLAVTSSLLHTDIFQANILPRNYFCFSKVTGKLWEFIKASSVFLENTEKTQKSQHEFSSDIPQSQRHHSNYAGLSLQWVWDWVIAHTIIDSLKNLIGSIWTDY